MSDYRTAFRIHMNPQNEMFVRNPYRPGPDCEMSLTVFDLCAGARRGRSQPCAKAPVPYALSTRPACSYKPTESQLFPMHGPCGKLPKAQACSAAPRGYAPAGHLPGAFPHFG